jgi:hypothetical protein
MTRKLAENYCFSIYQNKVLKCIVNALLYLRNSDIHRDLGIDMVTDITAKFANYHEMSRHDHINTDSSRLLKVSNITRRPKQKKPFGLVTH